MKKISITTVIMISCIILFFCTALFLYLKLIEKNQDNQKLEKVLNSISEVKEQVVYHPLQNDKLTFSNKRNPVTSDDANIDALLECKRKLNIITQTLLINQDLKGGVDISNRIHALLDLSIGASRDIILDMKELVEKKELKSDGAILDSIHTLYSAFSASTHSSSAKSHANITQSLLKFSNIKDERYEKTLEQTISAIENGYMNLAVSLLQIFDENIYPDVKNIKIAIGNRIIMKKLTKQLIDNLLFEIS
ncbi:hypothetical protein Cyrtocomes_00745 [Candidatus Cyrtobacter comes]|uniref:Uncharacterized protein n=1 Tax=Candidatus Cyrtobacter comes TaxID=675776 RepID=A0ABU5L8C4_9RICK|nr:hypothetical protein [Candidatus Cyrtobacter comes]MDZ5762366.1 hypothetical protein [Candidatus Cyrtobacter comes]